MPGPALLLYESCTVINDSGNEQKKKPFADHEAGEGLYRSHKPKHDSSHGDVPINTPSSSSPAKAFYL